MAKAVFLDRDGVINRPIVRDGRPYPPDSLSEFELYEGVAEAIANLRNAGFLTIVVTNQPDVARGTQTRETVEAMHADLMAKLPLNEVIACYHDGDACNCRKPKPGALLEAKSRYDIDLERSFMVGDRWRDIEAGQRAGCICVFIDRGYSERQPVPPYARVTSLAEASEWILSPANSTQSGQELRSEMK